MGSMMESHSEAVSAFKHIVTDKTKLDLDVYLQSYADSTHYDRLIHIARINPTLRSSALKKAVTYANTGKNVAQYADAVTRLKAVEPKHTLAQLDAAWIQSQTDANNIQHQQLLADLKKDRNTLIKDNIRKASKRLVQHYEQTGQYRLALETLATMRSEAVEQLHLIDFIKRTLHIELRLGDWHSAISTAKSLLAIPTASGDVNLHLLSTVAQGLARLGLESYEEAARLFVSAHPITAVGAVSALVSVHDIATYGGILSLATLERNQIQQAVLNNAKFRMFLDKEPQVRKAVTAFVNCRFKSCLSLLDANQENMTLNYHLAVHVPALLKMIRVKCISQFLLPFSVVSLDRIRETFGDVEKTSMEDELQELIASGKINGRMDAVERVLVLATANTRSQMKQAVLETVEKYNAEAIDRLRRMGLAAADLSRKGSVRAGAGAEIGDAMEA